MQCSGIFAWSFVNLLLIVLAASVLSNLRFIHKLITCVFHVIVFPIIRESTSRMGLRFLPLVTCLAALYFCSCSKQLESSDNSTTVVVSADGFSGLTNGTNTTGSTTSHHHQLSTAVSHVTIPTTTHSTKHLSSHSTPTLHPLWVHTTQTHTSTGSEHQNTTSNNATGRELTIAKKIISVAHTTPVPPSMKKQAEHQVLHSDHQSNHSEFSNETTSSSPVRQSSHAQMVPTTTKSTKPATPVIHQQHLDNVQPNVSHSVQHSSHKALRSATVSGNCTECDDTGEWCCPSQSFCALDQIDLSFNCYRRKHRLVLNDSCESCATNDFLCCLTIVCTFDQHRNVSCAPIKSPAVNAQSLADSVQQSCHLCNASSTSAWCCQNGVVCQNVVGGSFLCSDAFSEHTKAKKWSSMLEKSSESSSDEDIHNQQKKRCPIRCDPSGKFCCAKEYAFCAWNPLKQHYFCHHRTGTTLSDKEAQEQNPEFFNETPIVKRDCGTGGWQDAIFGQAPIFKKRGA